MNRALFTVAITDDVLFENDERFRLAIDQTSLPAQVSAGNPDQATVTISDDDGEYYAWHSSANNSLWTGC